MLILVLMSLTAGYMLPSVFATSRLDQQQVNNNGDDTIATSPLQAFFAETFTAGLGGPLTEVDLLIGKTGCSSCGPVMVEIHDGSPSGGVLGGLLASTSLPTGSIPSGPPASFTAFTFSTPTTVVVGHVYTIAVTTSSAISPNGYIIGLFDPDSVGPFYSGGQAYVNFGSSWGALGGSGPCVCSYLAFKTFVQGVTTSMIVSCIPSTFSSGGSATCTATLSGFTGSVVGEMITLSQTGTGSVTFPSGYTCNLSSDSCSVTVTGVTAGGVALQASYPGDPYNIPSSGTFNLTVTPPIPEYPYGLLVLAMLMLLAYPVVKHRTRIPKEI